MTNKSFQQGRKPKNTWLAGKVKCGCCGYALKATHVPNSEGYFRCSKRTENKGCPGCGKIRKSEFEEFIFNLALTFYLQAYEFSSKLAAHTRRTSR